MYFKCSTTLGLASSDAGGDSNPGMPCSCRHVLAPDTGVWLLVMPVCVGRRPSNSCPQALGRGGHRAGDLTLPRGMYAAPVAKA